MSQLSKREHWEQRLAEFESSGLSAISWCTEKDVKLANFYYWRRRLRTQEKEPLVNPISWLPLEFDVKQLPGELTAEQMSVEIDARYKVIIQKGFSHEMFRDVINILQHL